MVMELDFQDLGIDIEQLLPHRSWRWFKIRVLRILGDPESRLHRVLKKRAERDGVQAT